MRPSNSPVCGKTDSIVRNDSNKYEGNLEYYYAVLVFKAKNIFNPYHNYGHTCNLLYLAYRAVHFYRSRISRREARNLYIAILFHDFNHPGTAGPDKRNIDIAIRALKRWIHPEDVCYQDEIIRLMRATQYPHVKGIKRDLLVDIIRDCDMSQAFSKVWIQQVIMGLAREWGKKPIEILTQQLAFFDGRQFFTSWGRKRFGRRLPDKLAEVRGHLDILLRQHGKVKRRRRCA